MAKRAAKQMEQEVNPEELLLDYQEKVLSDLAVAKAIAVKLFGGEPAPEVVYELCDYLRDDAKTEEEAGTDIVKAHEHAVAMFGKSSSDTTFRMFYLLFIKPFEPEGGEDENEEEE